MIDSSNFTVATTDLVQRAGSCLLPKLSVGGYTQTGTNIVVSTTGPHGLVVGNSVFINFTSGTAVDGTYLVVAVSERDAFHGHGRRIPRTKIRTASRFML